jgi:hypothetical protein
LKSQIRSIIDKDLSEKDLNEALPSLEFLAEAHKYHQGLPKTPSAQQLRKEFEQIREKISDLLMVANWIKNMDIQIENLQYIDIRNTKLADLEEWIREFDTTLGLDKRTIQTLSFFIKKRSSLFAAVTEQHRKKLKKQELTMKDVSEMVKSTSNFLEKLLDVDKMFLSDIDDIHQITIKFKSNFSEELNVA